jgi:hypothetical protein
MKLNDFILNSCCEALTYQDKIKGYMPAGHNGPYFDPETPVRNTAHWCISFIKSYRISKRIEFREAAIHCGDYLLSKDAVPMGSVFFCRMNPKKDFSNGLVGQAWAIEALVALFELTQNEKYIDYAVEIFKNHPYDKKYHAWVRLNVDGSLNGFDKTFNHELWFAAAGSLLAFRDNEIRSQVIDFMEFLDSHFEIFKDGCVKHKGYFLDLKPEEKVKRFLILLITSSSEKKYIRMKSIGYHSFNTYALSIIKNVFPELDFWKSKKIKLAVDYLISNKFYNLIDNNKYALPYNVTGFEVPFAIETFFPEDPNLQKLTEQWLNRQILFGKKEDSYLLTEKSKDPNTSMARLYELCRLKNDYNITV